MCAEALCERGRRHDSVFGAVEGLGSVKGGSVWKCRGGAGMFRTDLVDGAGLALVSLLLAVAVTAAHGLHPVSLPGPGRPGQGQLPDQARPGQ